MQIAEFMISQNLIITSKKVNQYQAFEEVKACQIKGTYIYRAVWTYRVPGSG